MILTDEIRQLGVLARFDFDAPQCAEGLAAWDMNISKFDSLTAATLYCALLEGCEGDESASHEHLGFAELYETHGDDTVLVLQGDDQGFVQARQRPREDWELILRDLHSYQYDIIRLDVEGETPHIDSISSSSAENALDEWAEGQDIQLTQLFSQDGGWPGYDRHTAQVTLNNRTIEVTAVAAGPRDS